MTQLAFDFTPPKACEEKYPSLPWTSKLRAPAIGHAEHVLGKRFTKIEYVGEESNVLIFKVQIHRERFWAYVRRIHGDCLDYALKVR